MSTATKILAESGVEARPRRRHTPEVRRRMITSTALDLFARRGYRSVTIRDIADACDINLALIYHYFRNKEDLFRASLEAAITEALDRYQGLREHADHPVDLLNGWFDINIELFEPLMRLVKVVVDRSYAGALTEEIDRLIDDLYRREIDLLRECIDRGVAQGLFNPVDSEEMAIFVSVHLDGVVLAAMNRPGASIEAYFENLRAVLWQQLGYEPDGPSTSGNGPVRL